MAQGTSFNMEEEFAGLDFHSIRPEERFVRTMETLIQQPETSIWEASKDRAEAKAIYRMLGNESFDREEVARAHREATIRRMAEYGGTILAVQDTTGVNYNREESRDGSASHESKKIRPIEEKESFRWLETLERSTAGIPPKIPVITVCDREGDMAD
jgi:hypothetical protein